MTSTVTMPGPAKRALTHRLPEAVATAALEFIYGPLAENPHRVGKRLQRELAGRWSARRGEYRIIYRFDDERVQVDVLDVDHRRDVYHRQARGRSTMRRTLDGDR